MHGTLATIPLLFLTITKWSTVVIIETFVSGWIGHSIREWTTNWERGMAFCTLNLPLVIVYVYVHVHVHVEQNYELVGLQSTLVTCRLMGSK